MVDKKVKKEHTEVEHKSTGHSNPKKNNTATYVILAIVILIAIIFVYTKYYPSTAGSGTTNDKTVIASVNGEDITLDELEKAYVSVPPQSQVSLTKKDLLNQMIEARLLFQVAKKEGYEISDEKAKEQLELAKKASGLTEEQFQQFLTQQKISEEDLITQIKKQVTVQIFLNDTIYGKIEIEENEIKDYYNTNKDKFKVEESVTVKHILIGNESMSDEEKNTSAQKILKEVNKDNFCDYVEKYSTDVGSVEKCGEYTFTKNDPLVPEFIDLSFSQAAGKIGIAKTQFGYHIIWTVKKTPAKTLPYVDAKPQIKTYLISLRAKDAYKNYYEEILGQNSIKITYYEEASK